MDNIIINVGRRYGSGGYTVARLLAEMFDCKLYDKELLNLAAKESGFSERFFESADERKRFFRSLFHIHIPLMPDNGFYNNNFSHENLFLFQSEAIRKAAARGSCVFVGRCADYVLRDFAGVFNVFITADLECRVSEISRRLGCDKAAAAKIIADKEKSRAAYYNYYTGKKWGDSASYHLCVNSSLLGEQATAEYIRDFILKYRAV